MENIDKAVHLSSGVSNLSTKQKGDCYLYNSFDLLYEF